MKKIKKSISIFIALCLCVCLYPSAHAIVEQSESFYAADYANVLSSSTEEMICNYNGSLEQQCQGAQIVVVTVQYLDGMYSDEYAYQLFNDWGVGSSEYNNGMLLLLATEENKAWLAYGMGLNSLLDSDDVDDMLEEYFWDDFDNGDYDAAVEKLFNALLKWYDKKYDSNIVTGANGSSGANFNIGSNDFSVSTGHYRSAGIGDAIGGIVRIIIIIAVLSAIFGGGSYRRRRRGGSGGSWLPWLLFFNSESRNRRMRNFYDRDDHDDHRPPRGGGGFGGFGGGSGGGGFGGGGFGGGMGHGGGGFSGGGGGRR